MSTMMVETMTIGPSMHEVAAGVNLVAPASTLDGPNIHDASRGRIVIKTSLKDYVKRQRETRRTLACFTLFDNPTLGEPEPPASSPSSKQPSAAPLKGDKSSADVSKSSQLRSDKPKQSIKVHSGRIEKPKVTTKILAEMLSASRPKFTPSAPRVLRFNPTPSTVIQVAEPVPVPQNAPKVATAPTLTSPLAQRQACICHNPEACLYCRFLTLADMFCAIVTAQEQKSSARK